jgi:hypothetical protein
MADKPDGAPLYLPAGDDRRRLSWSLANGPYHRLEGLIIPEIGSRWAVKVGVVIAPGYETHQEKKPVWPRLPGHSGRKIVKPGSHPGRKVT